LVDPGADARGPELEYPYFFYLVEHPAGNVLFDSGAHPSLIDRPRERLGSAVYEELKLALHEDDHVVAQLARAGFAPNDIGHVVHSHLHFDHAGGLEFFAHASAYIQRRELEVAYDPPEANRDFYCQADFDHRSDWIELDGEHDMFGDEKIVLIPTPGHTDGHQSMVVRLDGGAIILVADAAYLPSNMEQRVLPSLVADPVAMVASWQRIEAVQSRLSAQLIFTHDLAWPERTRVAPDQFYE
jgi:N-acyl homoserine lactone hydrolase